MFNNSQNSSISHSHLNVVYGDQTVITTYSGAENIATINTSGLGEGPSKRRTQKRRQHSILDDEIRRGDMIIIRRISERTDSRVIESDLRQDVGQDSPVRIELVKLVSKKRESRFTAITYEGTDAHEMWSRDLEKYSLVRESNSWQLYAFSRSISPSLIFHQELIPMKHLERNLPFAYNYLLWRFSADWGGLVSARNKYFGQQTGKFAFTAISMQNIWMDVSTGSFCWGPPSDSNMSDNFTFPQLSPLAVGEHSFPPLVQFSSSEAIESYCQIAVQQDIDKFLKVFSWSGSRVSVDPFQPCQLGSTIKLETFETIGYVPVTRNDIWLQFWDGYPQDSGSMDNAWFKICYDFNSERVSKTPSTYNYWAFVVGVLTASWEIQSPYIFEKVKSDIAYISVVRYEVFIPAFTLATSLPSILHTSTISRIYLFIPPAELSWTENQVTIQMKPEHKPFWTFDSRGGVKMKSETMELLGLPPITLKGYITLLEAPSFLRNNVEHFLKASGYSLDASEYLSSRHLPKFRFNQEDDDNLGATTTNTPTGIPTHAALPMTLDTILKVTTKTKR